MKYLEIKNLTFKYDKENIFNNLNITLDKGEILAIIGKSGIGKTTLLRIITGLETEYVGNIYLDNNKIDDIPTHKRNIGYITQDYSLFPHKTVYQNISFVNKDNTIELLNMIKMMKYKDKYPYELSGGQQQRVALARTLATKPSLLLMDEPFSNIDENLKNEMIEDLKKIFRENNITVIIVSHNKDDIEKLATQKIEF